MYPSKTCDGGPSDIMLDRHSLRKSTGTILALGLIDNI